MQTIAEGILSDYISEVRPPVGQDAEVYLNRIENTMTTVFSPWVIYLINELLLFVPFATNAVMH